MIQFDVETHTYTDDFGVVPSVTQVLTRAGMIDTQWFTPEAAERGTNVAKMTEFFDDGELDTETLPEYLVPFLDG